MPISLLHYSKAQGGSNNSLDSRETISNIVIKPTPEMPLLSATLDYAEKQKNVTAAQPHRVFPISKSINIYSLFWIDDRSILIDSFQGDAFSFSGFNFHKLSLENGRISPYGEFHYSALDEVDPAGLTMYAQRKDGQLRLWNVSRYEQPQLPYSQLVVNSEGMKIEHMRKSFEQSNGLRQQLKGQILRPFGTQTKECTNTTGESSPIIIADVLGNEYAQFELLSSGKKGFQKFRIEPTVQPLTMTTKDGFIGLLMTTDAHSACFTERVSLDLQMFRIPHTSKEKKNRVQKVEFKTILGKGNFYHELLEKWKVGGWVSGTIEWAELLNEGGAVIFRRDTRVGQELWCSEIWYYDEMGKSALIDFEVIVSEGGYLRRFTIDKTGNIVQEPHLADYWGIGYSLVPAVSPDRTKIAYVKDDEIWLIDLPEGDNAKDK